MKKMLLASALALLITGCAQQTFTVQNKPATSSTQGNHHPSFLRFWSGEENCGAVKICGGAENIVKTRQTFVNGLLGFITLSIYTPLGAILLLTIITPELPYDMGKLYLHCSLIYFLSSSSCFCIVISLSLRVK